MRTGRALLLGLLTYGCGLTTSDPNAEEDGTLGGRNGDDAEDSDGPASGGRGSTGGSTGGRAESGGAAPGGADAGSGGQTAVTGGAQSSAPCGRTRSVKEALYLKSQSDVESFANVGRFEGSLYITGDATDLSPLACLGEVTGDLAVFEAEKLQSLEGLEGLRKVGGLLALGHYCTKKQADCVGNPVLEDVSALSGLERAKKILIRPKCAEDEGGPHDCAFNAALKSVSFDSLREAESVELERNPLLEEAHFNALESASALKVIKSEPLRVLSFESLTTLGELYIYDARALEELRMPELVHSDRIEMVFVALKDFGGFGSLNTLGLLDLNYNELRSLRGLEKLSSARSIGIMNHAELESIEALSSLENVSEDIYLLSNHRLESLHGLESLEQANGVTIAYCHALEDLEPLSSLKTVQSWLVIRGNEGLLSLQGLEKVETTKRLSIESNPLLPSLDGLDGFKSVGSLHIERNASLPSCEAERFVARLTLDEPPTVESNDDQATCPPLTGAGPQPIEKGRDQLAAPFSLLGDGKLSLPSARARDPWSRARTSR